MNKVLFFLSYEVISPGAAYKATTIPSIKKMKNKIPWEGDIPIRDLKRVNIRKLTATGLPGLLGPGSRLTKNHKKLKKRGE
jgi:hypothetical protein